MWSIHSSLCLARVAVAVAASRRDRLVRSCLLRVVRVLRLLAKLCTLAVSERGTILQDHPTKIQSATSNHPVACYVRECVHFKGGRKFARAEPRIEEEEAAAERGMDAFCSRDHRVICAAGGGRPVYWIGDRHMMSSNQSRRGRQSRPKEEGCTKGGCVDSILYFKSGH